MRDFYPLPIRYSCMALDEFLPAPMARITEAGLERRAPLTTGRALRRGAQNRVAAPRTDGTVERQRNSAALNVRR